MEKRRFSRVGLAEKSIIEHDGRSFEVSLVDISLKGALVRFGNAVSCSLGDRLNLSFLLGGSDIPMQFSTEVVHVHDNMVGVKFIETGLDTMIHLRGLMEARTLDPDKVQSELAFLIDDDK
jgi:c-di-GMP-binding flagellar brake protein YcgR